MVPKSMTFEPQLAGIFRPMPNVTPDNVEGTAPVTSGQKLAFRVSGTGVLAELQGRPQQSGSGQLQTLTREPTHSGGAQKPPYQVPVRSEGRDSIIAGGLTVALAAGIVCMISARRAALHNAPTRQAEDKDEMT